MAIFALLIMTLVIPDPVNAPARLEPQSREAAFQSWRTNPATGPLAPGERLWECAMCPEMIVAPPGSVTLGSPEDEPGRGADEGPQRRIRIDRDIAVSRFEVTRAEYEAFIAATEYPVRGN